jgi:hypothetical protein
MKEHLHYMVVHIIDNRLSGLEVFHDQKKAERHFLSCCRNMNNPSDEKFDKTDKEQALRDGSWYCSADEHEVFLWERMSNK